MCYFGDRLTLANITDLYSCHLISKNIYFFMIISLFIHVFCLYVLPHVLNFPTPTDREQNVNVSDCEPCTPGQYCQEYGRETPNGPCDPGYFCPEGSPTPRPVDAACSPGHFCPAGSWNETGCPSGTYQPHWKQSDCDPCPAGAYCLAFGEVSKIQLF